MKTSTTLFGIAACIGILAMSSPSVFGQAQIIYMDENGNAYITPGQLFPHTIAVEPISGIATLEYTLPSFAGVAGDVLLQEAGGGPLSDVIRFDGNGHAFFFSDNADGVDSLADVGLPTVFSPNTAGPFLESGVEGGFQDYVYLPTASQPGYKAAGPVAYDFISDVPEPGVMMLGGLAGGLLVVLKSRRQAKRG